jgi:hypothetical protein
MWNKIQNIYIGTQKVRPSGWKPWANTIAYYPLEEDWNDYSWNWHNLTWNSTPTYTISWGTKQVVSLNGSIAGKIANLSWTYTNYTMSFWCKPTSNTNTWQEIFDNYKDSSGSSTATDNAYINFNWTSYEKASAKDFAYQYRPNGWSNAYQSVYGTTNRATNSWYNVVVTSTVSWIKIYVNWTQVASNSTTWTIILDSWYNCIWWRYNNYYRAYMNYFYGYLSEFIMENKTWTADEIADYYNQTKAKYWL